MMIEGGSSDARAPLNQSVPRKVTARAVEDVDYLAIDADLVARAEAGIPQWVRRMSDGLTSGAVWMASMTSSCVGPRNGALPVSR